MELFDYCRSSASYRVRIALNLKEVDHELTSISLLDNEQQSQPYLLRNPTGLVPTLYTEGGELGQSLAILEYLEERYPNPALLPSDPWHKAQCRALAQQICCDIHPLNNLRVLKYLTGHLELSEEQKMEWYHHWLHAGLQPLEQQLLKTHGMYSLGDEISLVDVCLIPQLFNAYRFELDMSPYPTLAKLYHYCLEHSAFFDARPNKS